MQPTVERVDPPIRANNKKLLLLDLDETLVKAQTPLTKSKFDNDSGNIIELQVEVE